MKYISFFNRALDIFNGCNYKGWDGADADAISKVVLANTLSLYKMLPNNIKDPDIIPNTDGSIQLEWKNSLISFQIEISTSNSVHCYFADELEDSLFNKDVFLNGVAIPNDILLCLQHFKTE